jgi:hypothetical protein
MSQQIDLAWNEYFKGIECSHDSQNHVNKKRRSNCDSQIIENRDKLVDSQKHRGRLSSKEFADEIIHRVKKIRLFFPDIMPSEIYKVLQKNILDFDFNVQNLNFDDMSNIDCMIYGIYGQLSNIEYNFPQIGQLILQKEGYWSTVTKVGLFTFERHTDSDLNQFYFRYGRFPNPVRGIVKKF